MRRFDPAAFPRLPYMIRFRLTLWYTGLAALVLAAFVGSVGYEFNKYQLDRLTSHAISVLQTNLEPVYVNYSYTVYQRCPASLPVSARAGLTRRYEQAPCVGFTTSSSSSNVGDALNRSGTPIQYVTTKGQLLQAAPSKEDSSPGVSVLKTQDAQRDVRTVGKESGATPLTTDVDGWHVVTVPFQTFDGQRVIAQMAQPLSRVQQQVDALMPILIYAAGVLLAVAAVGGWILAGRALKPIDEITRRARQITVHDLSQRINLDREDELGRMAETFDDMIARLEEAFERQKRFTSDASHELRTPLTVMQAELGLALARPRTPAEYRQTLASMDEEVGRLSAIVNDLLTLTRIDVDPAGMQHQPVALHELLAGLAKSVRVVAAERGIGVQVDHLDQVAIVGDATRLRQLFSNLLDNAVTYTGPGGTVAIALERTREGSRVRISDTGIGIATEHLPRIFERFYRTNAARECNAHGTGLGLAISRSVVQAHHGDITVESAPDQGTTFVVTLPHDGRKPVRRVYGLRALVSGVVPVR